MELQSKYKVTVDTLHLRKKNSTPHIYLPPRKMGKYGSWPSFLISLQSPRENSHLYRLPQLSIILTVKHHSTKPFVPPLLQKGWGLPAPAESNASRQSEALCCPWPTSCMQHPHHSYSCFVLLKSITPDIQATIKLKIQSFLNGQSKLLQPLYTGDQMELQQITYNWK